VGDGEEPGAQGCLVTRWEGRECVGEDQRGGILGIGGIVDADLAVTQDGVGEAVVVDFEGDGVVRG